MSYDPFVEGPHRVSTRTRVVIDGERNAREIPYEVWQPDGSGPFPMVVVSHTSGGHRRQLSFLCDHLATHGYLVAAPDHVGNTVADVARRRAAGETMTAAQVEAYVKRIIADRVPDLRSVVDDVAAAGVVNGGRIGSVGASFGGWAALAMPETDARVAAVVAMVPGGSRKPLPGIIPAQLSFAWAREVPTLILAAELDRFTPVDGIRDIYERVPSQKWMFVLTGAGHSHFSDEVDEMLDCTPECAHLFARGLALAHFDAALKGDAAAERFFEADPARALAVRGVRAQATA